jgi:rhomboid family GlyGly-CTERM serine protease
VRHESDGDRGTPGRITAPRTWLLGGVVVACLATQAGGDPIDAWLRFERAAVLTGQLWRIVSCHFVHLSGQHLAMNLGGLAVIAAVFGREYRAAGWVLIGAVAMPVIALGLIVLSPQVTWYVGLSGILHAAVAAGLVSWWRSGTRGFAGLLALALIVKLGYEQWVGSSALLADLPVVVDAHLYGAVAGLLAALVQRPAVASIE